MIGNHMLKLIRPKALEPGETIGVFTPSTPAYGDNEELFTNGVRNLERLGFKVKTGFLTERRSKQGYRSGSPQERAQEFMALVKDPEIRAIISTIGGSNSNSLIPYLDFDVIRNNPKIICGYSDVTSLHLAILTFSGLCTFYGPAVMTWFGDWPDGVSESTVSFLNAVQVHRSEPRDLSPFPQWSNHRRAWDTGDWKNVPREWKTNPGWRVLVPGEAQAPLIAANLSTLMSAAGTAYFPDMKGKILLIESMSALYSIEERNLRQLQLMGVFQGLAGLLVGKPEWPDSQGAPFTHNDLILEIVGRNPGYPVVSEFDCSHTLPMLTLAQMTPLHLIARDGYNVSLKVMAPMVE